MACTTGVSTLTKLMFLTVPRTIRERMLSSSTNLSAAGSLELPHRHVGNEWNVRTQMGAQYARIEATVQGRDLTGALVGNKEDMAPVPKSVAATSVRRMAKDIGWVDRATTAMSGSISLGNPSTGNTSVKCTPIRGA